MSQVVPINFEYDMAAVAPFEADQVYPEYHITQIPDYFRLEAVLHQDVMGTVYLFVTDVRQPFSAGFWIKVWTAGGEDGPEPGRMIQ